MTVSIDVEHFTDAEKTQIIDFMMSQTLETLKGFLKEKELPISGNKADVRDKVTSAIANKRFSYTDVIDWIDSVEPWNKQHIYLFDGPKDKEFINNWKNLQWVEKNLNVHGLWDVFNKKDYLFLPDNLMVSSIEHRNHTLRILAVEKRVFYERRNDLDRHNNEDETILYQAFKRILQRGIVIFEWNLFTNKAMLQISQLYRGMNYEDIRDRFYLLVDKWINLKDNFGLIDISVAINKLNEEERSGADWIMSQKVAYDTESNKHIEIRSATANDSTLGDQIIDETFDYVREHGIGKLGNFYWLPNDDSSYPIKIKTRTLINAHHRRINFPKNSTEEAVRHVLQRMREFSEKA